MSGRRQLPDVIAKPSEPTVSGDNETTGVIKNAAPKAAMKRKSRPVTTKNRPVNDRKIEASQDKRNQEMPPSVKPPSTFRIWPVT